MLLINLTCAFLFISIGLTECDESESVESDSECILYPKLIYMCKDLPSKTDFKIDAKGTDGKAKKFDMDFQLAYDITKTTTFKTWIYSWEDEEWNEFYKHSGTYCEFQEQVLGKASKHVRAIAEPIIADECVVKKGHYIMNNTELSKDDMQGIRIDSPMKLKVIFEMDNMGNENIICLESEIEALC